MCPLRSVRLSSFPSPCGRGKGHSQSCAENRFDILELKLDRVALLTGLSSKRIQIRFRDSVLTEVRNGESLRPLIERLEQPITGGGRVGILYTGNDPAEPGELQEHDILRPAEFSEAHDVHAAGFSQQGCTNDAMGNRDHSPDR